MTACCGPLCRTSAPWRRRGEVSGGACQQYRTMGPSAVSFPIPSRTMCGFSAAPTEDTLVKHPLLATIFAAAIALPAYSADYTIMAPAAPGGGWDQTARSLQTVMQKEGISGNVQVQNVPGAG